MEKYTNFLVVVIDDFQFNTVKMYLSIIYKEKDFTNWKYNNANQLPYVIGFKDRPIYNMAMSHDKDEKISFREFLDLYILTP